MLNVNELTARMAKMSDAQLRQYAQLHKDDPYTLALAAAESKRRAQLRAAGQAQTEQQPTVADQTLAQMGAPAQMFPQAQLPEEQGIGVLPAENMAGMADGGIAGYADGGVVAFADEGLVKSSSSFGRIFGFEPSTLFRLGLPDQTQNVNPEGYEDLASPERRKLMDRYSELRGSFGMRPQTPEEQAEFERLEAMLFNKPPAKKEAGTAYKDTSGVTYDEYGNPKTAAPKTAPKTAPSTAPAAPYADTPAGRAAAGRRSGAGTEQKAPGVSTAAIDAFTPHAPSSMTDQFNIMKGLMPTGADYDTLATEAERGFAQRAKEREENKPKDKAYEGLEALLAKEESKAKDKEARNLNMALINAGLAIAGGRSQYALQNIAEGAQVGTKQYQEGLEKLEAAALERQKQAAMIDEARRAEARGDWKEAEALKQQAFEVGLGIKKDKIEAIAKITGDSLKAATDRVNMQEQIYSQDRRTIYQEQMRLQGIREQNLNDIRKANIMAAAYGDRSDQRGEITPALLLKQYNELKLKDPRFKKDFPDFESYVNHIMKRQQADSTAGWGELRVTPGTK